MRSWLAEAPARQMSYQAASRIWQQWVQPQGILGGLLNILLAHSGVDNPADQIHRVVNDTSKVAKQFTDPLEFRHVVDEFDPRAKKRKQIQIVGPAFNQLRGHAHEAIVLHQSLA